MNTLWGAIETLADYAFYTPLRQLYFYGVGSHTVGFWGGRASHDICAQLTHVDATHWLRHPDTCAALCEQQFYSFATTVATCVYFSVVAYVGLLLLFRVTCGYVFARAPPPPLAYSYVPRITHGGE